MISNPSSVFINDDLVSFTCVFPTQYSILSISPFNVLNTYSLKRKNISIGAAATCCGSRYIAVSGQPADPEFDTRSILVRDHSRLSNPQVINDNEIDIFRYAFDQHLLSFRLTPQFLICSFYNHTEVWDIQKSQRFQLIKHSINIHAPLCVSPSFDIITCTGTNPTDLCHLFISPNTPVDFANSNEAVEIAIEDEKVDYKKTVQLQPKTRLQPLFPNESTTTPPSVPEAPKEEFKVSYSTFKAQDEPVSLICFSPNNLYFAVASSSGYTIKLFRSDNHNLLATLKRARTAAVIYSMCFSPKGDFLAALTQKATLHFFDLRKIKTSLLKSSHDLFYESKSPNFPRDFSIISPGSSSPQQQTTYPQSMPSPGNVQEKTRFLSSDKAATLKEFYKIQLEDLVLSSITWFDPSQIAVISNEGKMFLISIEEDTCNEVGREIIVYKNNVREVLF